MNDFCDLETQGNVGEDDRITQHWGYLQKGPFQGFPLLFLLLLFTLNALAQGVSAQEVDGFLHSADGRQLPDVVNVDLCDPHVTVIQQSSAASAGRFYFQGLSAADYVLKISADGFEPQNVQVNLQSETFME